MGTNDTQQEHIYNERIQEIFPLFDKIKKEDDPIYNARVDFNTVKFLTKHANWNWDEEENKDKAYGVILQKCDKTKKAGQELESEVKERLKEYVDDVAGVSIYGNHASITLGDNKKEFKISEFLNSDFCEKNEISGFSTLHSDGKSGMHGFVAEEEGKKIRHYVVTDGSYEMTLKWYAEGKECKIKIKIDANGVDLVKGDDFSLERLEVNRDVKIGGLFLHEIQFREKGQGKANEMQHNKDSNELSSETTTRIDVNRGVSVQATDITQKKEDHLSHFGLQSNSRRQSYDSGIGKDFDDKINSQEAKEKRELRQAAREANSGGQVYNLQSLFEENPQNKKTPPPLPPRTSSLPPKKGVFDEQGGAKSGSQKPDDLRENEQTPNNQQKGATSDSSDSSTFTKSVSHNQDNRQEDERYDNPTFGHAVPGSQKPDRSEQTPNDQQQPKTQQQEGNSKGDLLQDIRNFKKNNLRHIDVDDRKASIAGSRKNNPSPLETLKDRIPYSSSPDNSDNQDASDAKWKESEQPLSATALNNKSDSGYSSPTHDNNEQSQVNPEQLKKSLENIEQSDQTPPENLLKEIRDRSQQDNRGLRQVDPTDKLSQDKEDGLQKDNLADVKTVEGPTVNVSASTPNSISDSGYISPTNSDSKSQTDLKQVGRKLEEHIRQSNLTLFEELKNTLGQENLRLKPADQSQISEETKKRLREVGLLKDSSTDIKANDSGYSSPTHDNNEQSQVNPGQLKASLMNVEQRDDTLLTEFTSKLDKETQKFPLKPVDQRGISEQTKEHLLAAGLLKDSSTDVKTVAERENADTNPTVDKNSELYKLLEKDEAQLKAGVIEEERGDTLTEHTDGYDRNRIALANRNKRPLDWAKQVAESQQKKDTNKGISI
ncbi:hypothetical protein [Wolbachia endosymbiont of Drosophila pseudotakahashii]|uniref:hypothetical protein n=1 Tax=Wolbachia endosymbiont of Drosophila pseudotakahashii TaxID=375919 RepID=UPI00223108F1|nr:hypothetical protein [Wolbachia endosymbiont of Drosophila pseudotakahashii]UZE38157.1 hypothetical protein ONI09_04490 [Wolbachia endosymbiont of Drosophila pseudotakahashii]